MLLITVYCRGASLILPVLPEDSLIKSESKSSLKSKVTYTARDSIRFDISNQKVYLFGDAKITYEGIELKAGYIELDLKNNIVDAKGVKDSLGNETELPMFSEEGKGFSSQEMKYNFETKKGQITDVLTKEGEGFIHGKTVKKDTNDIYYIKHGKYTTCDLPHPHFYIGATKLKVIPEDKIITGPAYLSVADIPTPLAVPFGFFPNKKGQSSGIIIPTYGESPVLGFFLKEGGYYFGISDYLDLTLKGDAYSLGSWNLKTLTNYNKRYKFNGNLSLSYAQRKEGISETPSFKSKNDFFIQWAHTQDAKAKPGSRFSANVNAGSSTYNTYNSTNSLDYLKNMFQSNISYSKSFLGTPFNFSANARHSQNTQTRTIDVSLPELTLAMNRIYPFKNQERVESKWYDKIGLSWTANAANTISTGDSILFTENSLKLMKNGIKHSVPLSTSFNILKYLTVTPSISGSSAWYYKTIEKSYIPEDSLLVTDTISGFKTANEFSLSANFNTKLYGMYLFKRSNVKAIRHVMIPNMGISYRPDFGEDKYGYYKTVQKDALGNTETYSIFQNGIYGSPGRGKSALLSMNLNNNIEMKVKSKNDTVETDKKVSLLQALNIGTAYNMAVDSFNWSLININGRTLLFKKLDINANASFDPYVHNDLGVRENKFEWDQNKRIARLTTVSLALGTSLRSPEKKPKTESEKATEQELEYIRTHPEEFIDFDVPWTLSVYYNLQYTRPLVTETTTEVKNISQSLNFSGDLNLTPKWKIGFTSGYDFVQKDLSYTSVNIYRDLHCWEMTFNWIPFGLRQSYNINIRVKSAVLQDLKLTRKRDWYDYQ